MSVRETDGRATGLGAHVGHFRLFKNISREPSGELFAGKLNDAFALASCKVLRRVL